MAVSRIGGGDKIPRQKRFLSSGSWTVPNGVKWVKARIVGAGASGAFVYNGSYVVQSITGVGGGSVIDGVISVTPGTSIPVVVAAVTPGYQTSNPNGDSLATIPGINGASSSFGGLTAAGGLATYGVSSGPGSGVGAGLPVSIPNGGGNGFGYDNTFGGDGIDGLGAGSGSFYASNNSYNADPRTSYFSPPGAGGVRATALIGGQFSPSGNGQGIDAPIGSGAGGGSLTAAIGAAPAGSITWRAGNGGSGIVILDWEEYA